MQNNYLETLENIILSENVVDNFYNQYNKYNDFHNWLNSFIPEIEKCEKQQQNTPWHKYNVLGHILHSIEEMNKCTHDLPYNDRRLLAYTMLFHDIGKPDCHIVREKNGKLVDSFFNHNIRSCEIAKELLPKLNFNQEEISIILKLVHKHDIFMFIKLNKHNNPYWRELNFDLIQEEILDLNQVGDGLQLLKYLVLVGRCDNLAQNELMTADSLAMLDKFDQMLETLS